MLQLMIYFFVASTVISLVRGVVGPTVADRLVSLNVVAAQVLALLVLIAVNDNRPAYLDVALVYDIFGFVGLLAITRYLGSGEAM
ncbi:MAG: monovalent cation/H+ antiporter complex subunit F [Spirochaetota bacterium]